VIGQFKTVPSDASSFVWPTKEERALNDMQTPRYCIYNQTNECFLSLGTRLGCDPLGFLKRAFRRDSDFLDEGYWFAPLRRLKTLGIVSFHDLLYLDDRQKVVAVVESFLMPRLAPRNDEASSLLVLPRHTISASRTQVDNQLVICPPEEMETWLRTTPDVHPEEREPEGESSTIDATGDLPSTGRLPDQRWSSGKNARYLCAHYRHRGSMAANRIRDISESGLYLVTDERWPVGTRVTMTLELKNAQKSATANPILVHLKVTRWGPDGLALEFVSPQQDSAKMECDSLLLI